MKPTADPTGPLRVLVLEDDRQSPPAHEFSRKPSVNRRSSPRDEFCPSRARGVRFVRFANSFRVGVSVGVSPESRVLTRVR
jgi:hypothetical protein